MHSLGHIARGLFGSGMVLAVVVAATIVFVHRRSSTPTGAPLSGNPAPGNAAGSHSRSQPGEPAEITEPVDDRIRVALTRRPVHSVELRIDGPFRIVTLDDAQTIESVADGLATTQVAARGDGIAIGEQTTTGGGIALVPEQSPGLWLDGRQYRGIVRLHVADDGRLWPVNVLPREEYLAAVVDSEMPATFPDAAREAQAIVARSYAVSCQRHPPHRWFDLFSTPISQNYLGVVYRAADGRLLAGETPAGRAAASATDGMVCTSDGQLFRTYYSACCGGTTLSGRFVFDDASTALASVPCETCQDAPLFRWRRSIDQPDRLNRLARTRVPSFGSVESARTVPREDAPAVVVLSDGRRTVRLPATELKSALNLPSLMFDLTGDPQTVTVRGRGHGHGVGLCQWGAKGLAERGLTAEEILQHYYPGSVLVRLSPRGSQTLPPPP